MSRAGWMRALTFDEFQGPLAVHELPIPEAPEGGAVVKVAATGLCRSDWHAWMGHDSDVTRFPHIGGHEYAGIVTAVGEGVERGWLGKRVTAPFVLACGTCLHCQNGEGQVCPQQLQPGFTLPGSFAEYVAVPAAEFNLVELPEAIGFTAAAGLGCRVATAFRAVRHRARVTPQDRVLVIGCGGVGLAAVAFAARVGADVIAVDVDAQARQQALAVGAAKASANASDLDGVTVSLDCLGSPAACRQAILSLAPRGRHVQVGLLPPAVGAAEVPMERVIGLELDILGSHGMAASDYADLLEALGREDSDAWLSTLLAPGPTLTLEDAIQALPAMRTPGVGGLRVIDPGAIG